MTVLDRPEISGERTLIDELLAEQGRLTAVERFSQWRPDGARPAQARYYRDLIPLSAPKAGEQYAFEVDLDLCSGCKACVTACHSLNGLAEGESWRSVGLVHGGGGGSAVSKTVTTACHHCLEPACLDGCPALAYEKDPVTGIVRHLDDQCIGCQYCTLKCPYGVPKYHPEMGIVRKCDLCSGRLAEGEAPACVQACPNEAIRVTVADRNEIRRRTTAADRLVPGAPPSDYTVPTTRYRSRQALGKDAVAGDHLRLEPEHSHPALVWMLVLTQGAVGLLGVDLWLAWFGQWTTAGLERAVVAWSLGTIGVGVSVFHLGRPLVAWRAVLGFRKSWLSREVICFGAFLGFATGYAATRVASMPSSIGSGELVELATQWAPVLWAGAMVAGLLGVICSAWVYADTRRAFWSLRRSLGRFLGTAMVLGLAAGWAALGISEWIGSGSAPRNAETIQTYLAIGLIGVVLLKVIWELGGLMAIGEGAGSELGRSALLLAGPLRGELSARIGCGLVGGVALPLAFLWREPAMLTTGACAGGPGGFGLAIFGLLLAGELLERRLFFKAVVAPRMPGDMA